MSLKNIGAINIYWAFPLSEYQISIYNNAINIASSFGCPIIPSNETGRFVTCHPYLVLDSTGVITHSKLQLKMMQPLGIKSLQE